MDLFRSRMSRVWGNGRATTTADVWGARRRGQGVVQERESEASGSDGGWLQPWCWVTVGEHGSCEACQGEG